MTALRSKVSMRTQTTFKIGGDADEFVEVQEREAIPAALDCADPVLVLGGGSNLLVSDDGFRGRVVQIGLRGIEVVQSSDERVVVRIGAGELWDDVVAWSVAQGLWGLENLSRIPGRSGAFIVQNVGAYGVEAKELVQRVEVYDRRLNDWVWLDGAACAFGYRSSIFNTTERGRYVIASVEIELSSVANRRLGYPDLVKWFANESAPSQQAIRVAIRSIRDTKFPFPATSVEGNAGSFFKNAIVSEQQYAEVESHFATNLPEHLEHLRAIRHRFPVSCGIKIPTAFVLDACGLKGYGTDDVQLNPVQPVIVLNKRGRAHADDVLRLVREVRAIVRERTGLHLLTEPELIGFSVESLREYGFTDVEIARYVGVS